MPGRERPGMCNLLANCTYYSKHGPEKEIDWGADDIQPQDVWNNHTDQSINIHEVMSFDQGHSWNFALSEDLRFSGQNHQKETYPHTGSSQYQSSSSRTVQPNDADLSDGNYANYIPHFDGTGGALRMQQNLNNSQPVDHPPREEDIQMSPPEQNPILQQPIVPPQRNNDDPQGIHKNNRAEDDPDPDEQKNPAQALLGLQNENLFNHRENV
ncbi:hypothetical protein PPACK8108_LOCUS10697 [Phakopsora pachyrhizi]|uniref:Uncharacterized protein n=1 Tax=Phakopsora pachyrhizi TaxID=170000 RepID=A0AAV0B0V6_PHAPC|nr:hypothetical protein PPACK8108_LOCUS10697 [Phakopsora pachyrhizi]